MAETKTQKGYILIADISGYTRFLTQSELQHAHEILRELMYVIRDHMDAPVRVLRTEGDALFGYLPAESLDDAPYLLDLVEQAYMAFKDRLFHVKVSSTCDCNACSNTTDLDLKFFAHFAEFIVEDLGGGRPDLSGPQVILAHRLLKTNFVQQTGIPAYFMVTDSVFESLGSPVDAIDHQESFEHFGDVQLHVFDLSKALERRQDERRVVVALEHADVVATGHVQAPPSVVWSYLTDASRYPEYGANIHSYSYVTKLGERRGPGVQMHCNHGNNHDSYFTIVDWSPFESMTIEIDPVGWFLPGLHLTTHLKPNPRGGTDVSMRCRFLKPSLIQSLVMKFASGKFKSDTEGNWKRLNALIQQESALWAVTHVDLTAPA